MKHFFKIFILYASYLYMPFIQGAIGPFSPGEGLCNYIGEIGLQDDINSSKLNSITSYEDEIINSLAFTQTQIDIIEPQNVYLENQYNIINSVADETLTITENLNYTGISPAVDNRKVFVSVFGDQIEEHRYDILNFTFAYGIPTINMDTTTSGGGTVTNATSMAIISSGTGATSVARLESMRNLRYRTGREGYCFFTAMFANSAANSTQWIGLLNDTDGSAIGFSGTNFSLLFRKNSVNTIVQQNAFNLDPIDGTGPSGFDIDPTKLNVFRISYGWLGAATITYQVLDQTGAWISFHRIEYNNSNTTPSYTNPSLPMRAEVVKTSAGATNLQLSTASWAAGIVYEPPSSSNRYFTVLNSSPTTLPLILSTETHVITIRNKTIYNGFNNKIEVRLVFFGGISINTTINTITLFYFKKNATVTGTSFSDVDSTNSVMEFSTAGTYSLGTGTNVIILPAINQANNGTPLYLASGGYEIILLPGETLTVTASNLSILALSNQVIASLAWSERF